jgi:hypothetical protein
MMPHLDNLRSGLLLLKSPKETEKFTWEIYIERKKNYYSTVMENKGEALKSQTKYKK